mgnify:CR=1 FL=1
MYISSNKWNPLNWKVTQIYWSSYKIFREKRCSQSSAASAFYIILSVVPLSLLAVRLLRPLLGTVDETKAKLFMLGTKLFPAATPQILNLVNDIITRPLHGKGKFTLLNIIFLLFASVSFSNSILKGVYAINGGKGKSWWRMLEGFVLILASLTIVGVSFLLPTILAIIEGIIRDNFILTILTETFPFVGNYAAKLTNLGLGLFVFLRSNYLYFFIFLFYFSFLYNWFFSWQLTFKQAMFAGLNFVVGMFFAKHLFILYVTYARTSMVKSYGDYHTYVLGMIWLNILMALFFYGACLCQIQGREYKSGEHAWA